MTTPPSPDEQRRGLDPTGRLDELLGRVERLGEEGEWESAVLELREALAEWPEVPALLCWLGTAEREIGLDGIAYERFRRVLEIGTEDPLLLAVTGTAIAAFDDPEAEGALRTATILAPGLAAARWRYGAWLTREGFVDEGLTELEAALELDPELPVIHYELGVALALQNDPDRAADHFARGVELDPGDAWGQAMLGLALVASDRIEESVVEFDRAAEGLRDARTHLLAALGWAVHGDEGGARIHLERARQLAEGTEEAVVDEVEDRLDEGGEPARELLVDHLAPITFRERLQARP